MLAVADSLMLFMAGMEKTYVILNIQIAVIPIHIFNCWLLINKLHYGLLGAAMSDTITSILTVLLQIFYISRQESASWFAPTVETFKNLGDFI
jgi:Na+-driven multidrug efflux pump